LNGDLSSLRVICIESPEMRSKSEMRPPTSS
jgi:hypothetical protein